MDQDYKFPDFFPKMNRSAEMYIRLMLMNGYLGYNNFNSEDTEHSGFGRYGKELYDFNEQFKLLLKICIEDNFFWEYCPLQVYENNYQKRLDGFCLNFDGSTEVDFIIDEITTIRLLFKEGSEREPLELYFSARITERETPMKFLDNENPRIAYFNLTKKLSFLEDKLKSLSPQKELVEEYIDYSDNKIPERLLFMKYLGIYDFLEMKLRNELHYYNVNKLAQIVSTFTGVPQPILQSSLNRMLSKGVDRTKSPENQKNVNSVIAKLNAIGFKTIEQT